jgi:hypothetical protein
MVRRGYSLSSAMVFQYEKIIEIVGNLYLNLMRSGLKKD